MYIIYGKKLCNYCSKAINLLQSQGISFVYHSMDNRPEGLTKLFTIYEWGTVPLVIEVEDTNNNFIGGYDDLIEKLQNKIPEKNDQ